MIIIVHAVETIRSGLSEVVTNAMKFLLPILTFISPFYLLFAAHCSQFTASLASDQGEKADASPKATVAAGKLREMNTGAETANSGLPVDTVVWRDPANGTIIFLKAGNLAATLEKDSGGFRDLLSSGRFGECAIEFVQSHRSFFKLADPKKELTVRSIENDNIGYKHVRLNQVFLDIPVFGAELIVHFNKDNHIYLVDGRYKPTPAGLKIEPSLTGKEAREIVAGELPQVKSGCNECRTMLVIYYDSANEFHLAYQVSAGINPAEAWDFIIDSQTGDILLKTPTVYRHNNTDHVD